MLASCRMLPVVAILLVLSVGTAQAKSCSDCHPDVLKRMKGNSHHVQGTAVTDRHCYSCHWEAVADGSINSRYHHGGAKKGDQSGRGRVDLVLWGAGIRPTGYKMFSTAVAFRPAAMANAGERSEVAKITRHCLACHSDVNKDTRPFAGDNRTPASFAWDGLSIAARYLQQGVAPWGKYSTAKGNGKIKVAKAYSAHGNAAANRGGWSTANGYESEIPVTRGGASAGTVECFDCHNSHGSLVGGVTSSYRDAAGSYNGALLKETEKGRSGYRVTYRPSANRDLQSKNPYNAGAGLCFDCHQSAVADSTPWGYSATFGASQPIIGYKDTLHFGPGHKGSTSRYANRQSRTDIASSHLRAGKLLNYSTAGEIRGLCTPCHDPHGVSPVLGELMPYAVPLLKGTWLTSPYREDGPPTGLPGKGERSSLPAGSEELSEKGEPRDGAVFGVGGTGTAREPLAGMQYYIDRNTFGETRRITEDVAAFGGLCLKCHTRLKPENKTKTDQIHRAVKGWGSNKEHAFPCSKCHQAHNSGLPRLMQTNCLVSGPAGSRDGGGLSWAPDVREGAAAAGKEKKSTSAKGRKPAKGAVVGCHVRQFGGNSAAEKDQWNEKTKW